MRRAMRRGAATLRFGAQGCAWCCVLHAGGRGTINWSDARSVEKYTKLGSSAIRAGLERLHKRGRGEEEGQAPGIPE